MHLVIGGKEHGKLVDWPIEQRYWTVPVFEYNPITDEHSRTYHYRATRLVMFDRPIYIWLGGKYSMLNMNEWVDLFLKEILSYKGGVMFYSGVQDEI